MAGSGEETPSRAQLEFDGFVAAIAANPEDTSARLIWADWLDESDNPLSDPTRAEFIRLGVRRAQKSCPECGGLDGEVGPCGLTDYYRACISCKADRDRLDQIVKAKVLKWFAWPCPICTGGKFVHLHPHRRSRGHRPPCPVCYGTRRMLPPKGGAYFWDRGFPMGVEVRSHHDAYSEISGPGNYTPAILLRLLAGPTPWVVPLRMVRLKFAVPVCWPGGGWTWLPVRNLDADFPPGSMESQHPASRIPEGLGKWLPPGVFDTGDEAHDALGFGAVRWARSAHGLPVGPWPDDAPRARPTGPHKAKKR